MIIVDTPEKDLSNVDGKYDTRNVYTSSVKSSSTIFSCSLRAMYNRSNIYQKQCLMLKSYIPEINPLIGPKRHYEIFSYGNLFNGLTGSRTKDPHVIHPQMYQIHF